MNFISTGSAFFPVRLPGSLHLAPASEPHEDAAPEAGPSSASYGTPPHCVPTQVSTSTSTDDPPEAPASPSQGAAPPSETDGMAIS